MKFQGFGGGGGGDGSGGGGSGGGGSGSCPSTSTQVFGRGDRMGFNQPPSGNSPPPMPGTDGRKVRANFQMKLKVERLLSMMTLPQKAAMGHQVGDLLVDCEYSGTTCYPL